jgi:hypothetical protein
MVDKKLSIVSELSDKNLKKIEDGLRRLIYQKQQKRTYQ